MVPLPLGIAVNLQQPANYSTSLKAGQADRSKLQVQIPNLVPCLFLLQEVLLHTPWPQEVREEFSTTTTSSSSSSGDGGNSSSRTSLDVLAPAAASLSASKDVEEGASTGSCAGRGPCMRMGLAEGEPHSIMPDHLVRKTLKQIDCQQLIPQGKTTVSS
jgi:hypothetical protein